jgi:hypothetical protein
MTNNQHGQVPEALRLAEQYDHGDPAAHGNAWKAAVCTELRRLAKLEAQIEALSGMQALSAEPADAQLLQFYGVSTTAELIAAQARHIEKLQAKIPPTPSFVPQRVREGQL